MDNLFRILAGYVVAMLGGYLVVVDVKPFAAMPFFTGVVFVFGGLIFAHPKEGVPMLGYMVSAVRKLVPGGRRDTPEPEHEHRRSGDARPHHHERKTPTKRVTVSDFTISEPITPPVRHPHHRKRADDDGN